MALILVLYTEHTVVDEIVMLNFNILIYCTYKEGYKFVTRKYNFFVLYDNILHDYVFSLPCVLCRKFSPVTVQRNLPM